MRKDIEEFFDTYHAIQKKSLKVAQEELQLIIKEVEDKLCDDEWKVQKLTEEQKEDLNTLDGLFIAICLVLNYVQFLFKKEENTENILEDYLFGGQYASFLTEWKDLPKEQC